MRLQMIDQRLRVVDAEQFGGRGDDAVVEMGRDHRGRIDDGIARGDRVVLRRLGNPQRVEPEGRVLARPAADGSNEIARIEPEHLVRIKLVLADDRPEERRVGKAGVSTRGTPPPPYPTKT